jgi:hypothetical protein
MNIDERDERLIRIYDDISSREILLQPDFQRGEVWSSAKKKLLIDTILRKWHIPPVHVVVMDDGSYEVLDGQQRLTAIRDFVDNRFAINGFIQPIDESVTELHNKKYRDLDPLTKREFDRYTLKINEINNYNPGEPSELFHRLNQTVKLTSSEARNAIYGTMRNSISMLVDKMEEKGVNKDILGFSNSRMSYNDLLSRVIVYLEKDSLRAKLSEVILNSRYRDDAPVNDELILAIEYSIDCLSHFNSRKEYFEFLPTLTKASSLNWFYILCKLYIDDVKPSPSEIETAFFALEVARSAVKNNEIIPNWIISHFDLSESTLRELILIYIERSSSRVMSVGSILSRDITQLISLHNSEVILPIEENTELHLLEIIAKLKEESAEPKMVIEENLVIWKAIS